jgi:hypothetical protein
MVLLPVKQYYPQTDSATGHGDRMCFSSTCAMAIKYLVPGALLGSNADDDYLRTVLKYGDTTQYTSHLKACQQYGVFATFSQKGTRQTLINELKAGYPVATGILHKGHVSAPRGGGHWMLLIGDDGQNVVSSTIPMVRWITSTEGTLLLVAEVRTLNTPGVTGFPAGK